MLRTNSKIAKANIWDYIKTDLDYLEERRDFEIESGEPVRNLNSNANIAAFIWETFMEEMGNHKRRNETYFDAFTDWAQGLALGGLFLYYYNRPALDVLADILEETEEEKARYTEEKAADMLTHLIYREVTALKDKADVPEIVKIETEQEEKAGLIENVAAAIRDIVETYDNEKEADVKPVLA